MTAHRVMTLLSAAAILRQIAIDKWTKQRLAVWACQVEVAVRNKDEAEVNKVAQMVSVLRDGVDDDPILVVELFGVLQLLTP